MTPCASDPCDLDIKVIGNNEGPFVSDIRTLCAEITGQAEEDVPVRWRDNGKYRSITLSLHFEDADQVSACAAIAPLSNQQQHARRSTCVLHPSNR